MTTPKDDTKTLKIDISAENDKCLEFLSVVMQTKSKEDMAARILREGVMAYIWYLQDSAESFSLVDFLPPKKGEGENPNIPW